MSDKNNETQHNKKGNSTAKIIIIIIAILMIILGSISFGYYIYTKYAVTVEPETTTVAEITTKAKIEKNPIDFKELNSQNDEIYAWIKVPGTKVDYPICQSKISDEFYLKHDAYNKKWLSRGAVYTESVNSLDFHDRVTIIYGHNGYGDTMFTSLHKFEQKDFFDGNEYFYIYTPSSKLTYQIVSAFKYDDRHIMNRFDFQDNNVFLYFMKMIQNPDTTNKNVRTQLDSDFTLDDNIVVLSTCITNQKSNRYLVCGVLVSDEKTY